MIDRPLTPELLEAMAATLSERVVPELEGAPQHAARVVANLCRVLAREAASDDQGIDEFAALAGLLQMDGDNVESASVVAALDEALEAGQFGPGSTEGDEIFSLLQRNVARRLAVAKPSYLEETTGAGGS